MESTSCTNVASTKSLLDLNTDCIIYLCSFLTTNDRLRLAFVSDIFDTAIDHFIQLDRIRLVDLLVPFTPQEAEELLRRFGAHMKYLDLQYDLVEESREIKQLLSAVPLHCPNIEEIVFCYPWRPDFPTNLRIFVSARHIRKAVVVQKNEEMTGRKVEMRLLTPAQFDNRLYELFRNVPLLRSLDLSYLRELTGRHLPKLKNLVELNLEYCDSLQSKHLIALLLVVKLKTLNIINCSKLDETAFDALQQTQIDLEQISISNNYRGRNFHCVGRLRSLKQISFHDYSREAYKLSELIDDLIETHANDLESFEITNDFTYRNSSASFLLRISELKNLKKLTFPDAELSHDGCLKTIVRHCEKLEDLFVNLYENGGWVTEQTIHQIFRLKRLATLRIGPNIQISAKLLGEIYEILRGKLPPVRLDLFLDERSIDATFLSTTEYKENEHILRIHINEVHISDMLSPMFLF